MVREEANASKVKAIASNDNVPISRGIFPYPSPTVLNYEDFPEPPVTRYEPVGTFPEGSLRGMNLSHRSKSGTYGIRPLFVSFHQTRTNKQRGTISFQRWV